jgi:hypothetical protein
VQLAFKNGESSTMAVWLTFLQHDAGEKVWEKWERLCLSS